MKTNFDKINSFNKEELTKWLYMNFGFVGNTPWIEWVDENFCKKCEPVIGHYLDSGREVKFAPCEYGDCPFGLDYDDYSLIVRWLDSAETDDCD